MLYLRYFKSYIRLYRWNFWTGVIALLVTDSLDIIPPVIIGRGVDQIISNAGLNALLKTALLFAGITLSLALVRYHWRMQFGKFHQNIAKDLRADLFKKLTHLNPGFYQKNTT